jgi:hypothetical protein
MMSDEIVYFSAPIHKNHLGFQPSESLQSSLVFSMDGAIHGIKKSLILSQLQNEDVRMVKIGYKKAPKKLELKTEEDFLLVCAYIAQEDDSE